MQLYAVGSAEPRLGAAAAANAAAAALPPRCLTCVEDDYDYETEETPVGRIANSGWTAGGTSYYSHGSTHYDGRDEDRRREDLWGEGDSSSLPAQPAPPPPPSYKKGAYLDDESEPSERPCLYHNAIFSPKLSHFVLECEGPSVPSTHLYLTRADGDLGPLHLLTLQNNSRLKVGVFILEMDTREVESLTRFFLFQELTAMTAMPQVKTFPVQISGGYYAQVRLRLPPGLREEEITRYPLVVQV